MSQQLSQVLVLIEALLIGVPLGLVGPPLAMFFLFFAFGSSYGLLALALVAVLGSSFVAAIATMVTFIYGGSEGLRGLKRRWWVLYTIGAVLSVVAWVIPILASIAGREIGDELFAVFMACICGTPLLVPYSHLLLEKFLRKEVLRAH